MGLRCAKTVAGKRDHHVGQGSGKSERTTKGINPAAHHRDAEKEITLPGRKGRFKQKPEKRKSPRGSKRGKGGLEKS